MQVPAGQPSSASRMQTPPVQSSGVSQGSPRALGSKLMRQSPVPSLQTKPMLAQEASVVQAGMQAVGLVASERSLGRQS